MIHIVYRLVNRRKEKLKISPCYYIGSKMNYVPGKYWGSSHHPVLLQELKENVTDFQVEIIEHVNDPAQLTYREKVHQLKVDAINNPEYYNLQLANEKFTSTGRRWYFDPLTKNRGYFPLNKIPDGWEPGLNPYAKARNKKPSPVRTYSSDKLSFSEKISETLKGRAKDRVSVEKGMRTKREKLPKYNIYSANGELVMTASTLKEFSEKYVCSYGSLYETIRSKKNYKGFVFKKIGP